MPYGTVCAGRDVIQRTFYVHLPVHRISAHGYANINNVETNAVKSTRFSPAIILQ